MMRAGEVRRKQTGRRRRPGDGEEAPGECCAPENKRKKLEEERAVPSAVHRLTYRECWKLLDLATRRSVHLDRSSVMENGVGNMKA